MADHDLAMVFPNTIARSFPVSAHLVNFKPAQAFLCYILSANSTIPKLTKNIVKMYI